MCLLSWNPRDSNSGENYIVEPTVLTINSEWLMDLQCCSHCSFSVYDLQVIGGNSAFQLSASSWLHPLTCPLHPPHPPLSTETKATRGEILPFSLIKHSHLPCPCISLCLPPWEDSIPFSRAKPGPPQWWSLRPSVLSVLTILSLLEALFPLNSLTSSSLQTWVSPWNPWMQPLAEMTLHTRPV